MMDRVTYLELLTAHEAYTEKLVKALIELGVEENTTDMIRTELRSAEYIMQGCIAVEGE